MTYQTPPDMLYVYKYQIRIKLEDGYPIWVAAGETVFSILDCLKGIYVDLWVMIFFTQQTQRRESIDNLPLLIW